MRFLFVQVLDGASFRVILKPCSTKIDDGGFMANLTITIDEATLKKARIRALEQNTSVNRILREYLEVYAGVRRDQKDSINKIITLSNASASRRGKKGNGAAMISMKEDNALFF